MKRVLSLMLLLAMIGCHPVPVGANQEYIAHAQVVGAKYNLPPGLLETICKVESNWKGGYGRHGEIGVCQIKPATVKMTCPDCATKQEYLLLGSASDRVLSVQDVLITEQLYTGVPDGVFGRKTDKAVRLYQAKYKLKVDGIVGPQTWRAMFGSAQPYQSIIAQLHDPLQNIEYAGMHLRWLADTMNTEDPAILSAAYNGGSGHPVVIYMLRVAHRMPVIAEVDLGREDFYYDRGEML